jgi:hypothetical protein
MSLRQFLVRFALIHAVLLMALSLVLSMFDVQRPTAGSTPILIGVVIGCCVWFGRANRRGFTRGERRDAVLGMLAIDTVLQALFTLPLLGQQGGVSAGAIVFGLAFVALLHFAAIWVFAGFADKLVARQPPSKGDE